MTRSVQDTEKLPQAFTAVGRCKTVVPSWSHDKVCWYLWQNINIAGEGLKRTISRLHIDFLLWKLSIVPFAHICSSFECESIAPEMHQRQGGAIRHVYWRRTQKYSESRILLVLKTNPHADQPILLMILTCFYQSAPSRQSTPAVRHRSYWQK